jgi:hypothetical protein
MATEWAKMLDDQGLGGAVLLSQTALMLGKALQAAGFVLAVTDGKLTVRHPDGRKLDDHQREAIRKHRDDLIVLISVPPVWCFPIDWRTEWLLERDILLRHRAASLHAQDRERMAALAEEVPGDEAEWLALGYRMLDLVSELKAAGRLPEAVCLSGPLHVSPG